MSGVEAAIQRELSLVASLASPEPSRLPESVIVPYWQSPAVRLEFVHLTEFVVEHLSNFAERCITEREFV
jgi:hypothetical protein